MDCVACHLRHVVLATGVLISMEHVTFATPSWQPTSPSPWAAPHATFVTPSWQPASPSPWAASPANFVITSWTPACPSLGTTPNFVTSSSLTASPSPWATPLGVATAQQSPAPSMGDLWTNIRVDLAKMQATLQKVEQGLLQIKAIVQHEQHQLVLSARLQTSVAMSIQAAARGFLARRRVREMRRQMPEAALVTVDLGTRERDLALSNGQQQRHRAAVSKCEHGTCPAGDEFQLYDSGGREGTPIVIGKGALFSATTFRYRPPRGRLRWLLLRPIPGARPCAPLSSRWHQWDPGSCTRASPTRGGCPPYLMESKKSYSK
jgi:hypothetical protein